MVAGLRLGGLGLRGPPRAPQPWGGPVTRLRQRGPAVGFVVALPFLIISPQERKGGRKQAVIGLWKVLACQRRCKA